MGNGASGEAHQPPPSAGRRVSSEQTSRPGTSTGGAAEPSRAQRAGTLPAGASAPRNTRPYSSAPLTEATLCDIEASGGSDDLTPVAQSATARLTGADRRTSKPFLRSADTANPVPPVPSSPFLSPHPPGETRPARASPSRRSAAATEPGAPPSPNASSSVNEGRPPRGSSDAGRGQANLHGLQTDSAPATDAWCPPEFGPVLSSPKLSADDTEERFQDQKTMFYQLYLQTHGGSITNQRLKQRASAAVLIRERQKAPKVAGAVMGGGPSPSPTPDDGDPSSIDPTLAADPVDVTKYVPALYTFSREKTKTTFFIDQDGEMRRLFHTSGWHRLPSLSALAASSSTNSINSTDQNNNDAAAPSQKTRRTNKSSSSGKKKSNGNSSAGRKLQEAGSSKKHKTRPRSSSIRSGGAPNSFTSASQWSLGSQGSVDSEFFTSHEPPPVPEPILMRTSSFKRTASTSSLKYLSEADPNAEKSGTGELPSATKGRPVRPRVSFTANTSDFRASRRSQPTSGGGTRAESYDWEDDDEEAMNAAGFPWGIAPPLSPERRGTDSLALLKGKMRS